MDSRKSAGVRRWSWAARPFGRVPEAARARREAPRGDPESRSCAAAPKRGVEGDRRGEEEQGRGGGQQADGRGCATQGRDAGAGGGGEKVFEGAGGRARLDSQPAGARGARR